MPPSNKWRPGRTFPRTPSPFTPQLCELLSDDRSDSIGEYSFGEDRDEEAEENLDRCSASVLVPSPDPIQR